MNRVGGGTISEWSRLGRLEQTSPDNNTRDLSRIIYLIEIIRRYEFLVQHLLTFPVRSTSEGLTEYLARVQEVVIREALTIYRGNVLHTAKHLKTARHTLINKMNLLKINPEDYRVKYERYESDREQDNDDSNDDE